MKPVNQWFGLGSYDDYEGYQEHWYNWSYEWQNEHVKFFAGDFGQLEESEFGHGVFLPRLDVNLTICQSDIPEFYLPDNPDATYNIHTFSIIVWRWGFYVSVRGKVTS